MALDVYTVLYLWLKLQGFPVGQVDCSSGWRLLANNNRIRLRRCKTEKTLRTAKNTLKKLLAIKLHILIGPKAWWSHCQQAFG
jgi:hypothetical protein